MKQAVSILVMVLCALLITNTAVAEAEKWEIDKAHTNIYFDVRHTYATVRGQFDDFSGTLQFDPDNMALSSVKFEVKTTSINTGIPNRDNHLRSEETNEVAVLFTYFGTRENPLKKGKMVAGFETRFSIDRLEYQVGPGKYFEMGVIGRNVDILITLEVLK
jgi:polyisoprenoid-binding protein YceI